MLVGFDSLGHQAAVQFIHTLKSPRAGYEIKWISEDIEAAAIAQFEQQTSKNVSFVDCTTIALISHYTLEAIFSFDHVYKTNGIRTVDELLEMK